MVAGHRLFVLQKALFSGCARAIYGRRVFVLQKQLFPWALGSIKAGRLFCGIGWSSNLCSTASRYIVHMYYYSTFSRAWVQGDGRRERQKWFLVDAYPGIRPRIGVRGTLSQGCRVGRRGLTMAGDKPQPHIESEQLQQKMLAIAFADVS